MTKDKLENETHQSTVNRENILEGVVEVVDVSVVGAIGDEVLAVALLNPPSCS